jgi:hypothetical protein
MKRRPIKKTASKRIFRNTSAPHPLNSVRTTVKRGGIRLAGN